MATAPGAIRTNAVIIADNIHLKYDRPSIRKAGSCLRSTSRRDFERAQQAGLGRACIHGHACMHTCEASWAVSFDNLLPSCPILACGMRVSCVVNVSRSLRATHVDK